jgi:hypothetical protein
MAQKSSGRRLYRTANGKQIDLDMLISRNELTPAVGNARVNARGDELGPGGKIIRKREEVLNDYYQQQQGMREETVVDESKNQQPEADLSDWEEDEDGNFIRKRG